MPELILISLHSETNEIVSAQCGRLSAPKPLLLYVQRHCRHLQHYLPACLDDIV